MISTRFQGADTVSIYWFVAEAAADMRASVHQKDRNGLQRVATLSRYGLLSRDPHPALEQIVKATSCYFGYKIAFINFMTNVEIIYPYTQGIRVRKIRNFLPISYQTVQHESLFLVEDVSQHPDFVSDNHVVGAPFVRFYMGAPIVVPGAPPIGTLSVVDDKAHRVTGADVLFLRTMAHRVALYLQTRL